jgi:purine-binding chemotaxis protein CheW
MISFSVGGEEYGIDIRTVKEVIRVGSITPLPKAPSFVKGVINLRGDVIPIIDLRDKFGFEGKLSAETARIIVVEVGEKSIGMIVDSVSHVIHLTPDQIEAAPDWLGGFTREYLKGIARLDERLIVLLRIDNILTSDEKFELEKMEKN